MRFEGFTTDRLPALLRMRDHGEALGTLSR
jgi:hypothetical protein